MATQKPDFPSLLQPGVHKLTLQELYRLAVSSMPGDARRQTLFGRFALFCDELSALGVSGYTWVDGSFLTQKPEPDDIDCVLWPSAATPLSPENRRRFLELVNRDAVRAQYGLDLYLEYDLRDLHREAYWKGLMGFCHDSVTAKGFAEIQL